MISLKRTATSKKAERESFAETRRDGRTVVNADKMLKSSSVRSMLKKMVSTRSGFVSAKATD